MKRVIRANKYQEKSNRHLEWIAFLGKKLAEVAEINSPEELPEVAEGLGRKFTQANSKEDLMEWIVEELDWYINEFKSQREKSRELPKVKEELITYIDSALGFDLYKTKTRGDKEAYRIEHPNGTEPSHNEMNQICKALIDAFGVKFDEGLGGSWTSHSGHLRGVDFRVGFEEDRELDPSGREDSLQLQF